MTAAAGWLAGVLGLAGFIPYIISIIRKETTPNRATWLIWTLVGVMLGGSYYAGGATDTIWVAVSYVAGPFIIFILSIRRGEGGWTGIDKACLFTAAASAFFWWFTGSALIGLCLSLLADVMGAAPTVVKAFRRPEGEDKLSWTLWALSGLINLAAIDDWAAFSIVAYPAYMLICAGTVTALLYLRHPAPRPYRPDASEP
ncbi:MAG: hypothetical protein HZB85_10850 [Deltaproteobacteria bacterium]|nr:hypothetical protein [Deltaproteobacteria bacterium]